MNLLELNKQLNICNFISDQSQVDITVDDLDAFLKKLILLKPEKFESITKTNNHLEIFAEKAASGAEYIAFFEGNNLIKLIFTYRLKTSFHDQEPIPVLYDISLKNKYEVNVYRFDDSGDIILIKFDKVELQDKDAFEFRNFVDTSIEIRLKLNRFQTHELYQIYNHNNDALFDFSNIATIKNPVIKLCTYLQLLYESKISDHMQKTLRKKCHDLISHINSSKILMKQALEVLTCNPLFISHGLQYRNDCFSDINALDDICFIQKILLAEIRWDEVCCLKNYNNKDISIMMFQTKEKNLEGAQACFYSIIFLKSGESLTSGVQKGFNYLNNLKIDFSLRSEHIIEIVHARKHDYINPEKYTANLLETVFGDRLNVKKIIFSFNSKNGYKYYTFNYINKKFFEDIRIRNIPLGIAKLLELSHLNQFDLRPDFDHSKPYTYLFYATGKSANVKFDHRLVAISLVFATQLTSTAPCSLKELNFEKVFEHTLQEMANSLACLEKNKRPLMIKIFFHVLPIIDCPVDQFEEAIAQLIQNQLVQLKKLHFQKIIVKVRLKNLSKKEGYEFHLIEAQDFLTHENSFRVFSLPIEAGNLRETTLLTPTEFRELQGKSKGGVWAYDIPDVISQATEKFLEEELHIPNPTSTPFTFQELDLDPSTIHINSKTGLIDYNKGDLIPVSRPIGLNQAGIVVGLQSNDLHIGFPLERILLIGDITYSQGTICARECARINAAIRYAAKKQIPIDWFTASHGVEIHLDRGVESLDASASTAREIIHYCQGKGVQINLVVDETNVGAQSYWNALAAIADETSGILIMTPRGSMALTGPKALASALSTTVNSQEIVEFAQKLYPHGLQSLAGYEYIHGPNSDAIAYAKDLKEACLILIRHHFYTYKDAHEKLVSKRKWGAKNRHAEDLPNAEISAQLDKFLKGSIVDRNALLEALRDKNSPAPFKLWSDAKGIQRQTRENGDCLQEPSTIVQEMLIGSNPVMVVCPPNGPLTPADSSLISRAIRKAHKRLPVVIIGSLSGFSADPLSMLNRQLVAGASIAEAIVKHQGLILIVILGTLIGGTFVVLSKQLNPSLKILALERSRIQVIGGKAAAKVIFNRRISRDAAEDPRVLKAITALEISPENEATKNGLEISYRKAHLEAISELEDKKAAKFDAIHTVQRALQMGAIDEVIPLSKWKTKIVEYLNQE